MSRNRRGKPRWFEVRYQLAYQHVVAVGIEARNEAEAIAKAQAAFDAGTIWDDTAAMPLVYDDYEEADDNTLDFAATPLDEKPKPEASVLEWRRSTRMALFARQVAGLSLSTMDVNDARQALADLVGEARAITGIEPAPDDEDDGTQTDLFADPTATGVTRQVKSAKSSVVPVRVWPVTVGPSQQAEWHLWVLTDRCGELNENCNDQASLRQLKTDAALLGRLRKQMWNESTFVARKDGRLGILFESQAICRETYLALGCKPSAAALPYAEAVTTLWSAMERWMPEFPSVLEWAVRDGASENLHGPVAWVFAPKGSLTKRQRARLGNLLLIL